MNPATPSEWSTHTPLEHTNWLDQMVRAFFQWLDAPLVTQAAGEVARECRQVIWENVYSKIRGISSAQARGYVRAVAPIFIAREIDAVMGRRRVSASLRQQVMAEATGQVIDLIVGDVRCCQARPSQTVRTKAA